ncbi:MAG: hypothetical protein DRR16_25600 [Candidatus Parabeggiatoa sp. nov. 3]|nr:MAG: hypothetical protein DRR00_18565 [Gammaproteobacteria bacterium]RKZ58068.1 MAG: hypothetical protein DRQ99_25980 [Gammaproteobacteria bacterium]RKZ79485.1 MAG: hypothetical protein DRR16_25600 [Gammaproteobacteria bacterium]
MRANKFANFVLIGGILLFGMILAYALYKYTYYDPQKHIFVFTVISFVGMLICLLALKLRQDYKINLVLMSLSIVFVVYLVEIVLFFVSPPLYERERVHLQLAQKMGMSFDTRTKQEVIDDLKKRSVDAVPFVYPSLHVSSNGLEIEGQRIFPLGGISQKTTVLCNENGEWAIYESDEHGFNNPTGLFEEGIDLLFVGDSFAHGDCVKQGESIVGKMRRMSGMRVISLGSGASGPLIEFASLKEYGQPLKPKYVLWMYSEGTDQWDFKQEQQSPLLLKYRDSQFSQHLISRQSEIDSLLSQDVQKKSEKKRQEQKTIHIRQLFKIVRLLHLRHKFKPSIPPWTTPSAPSAQTWLLFTELLEKAQNFTSSWGGQLYFVYVPTWARYAYAKDVEPASFHHRNRVLSIVKELNIPIIDIHEKVFAVHSDPMSLYPFRVKGHYTNEGNHLVAQAIHAYLKEESLSTEP